MIDGAIVRTHQQAATGKGGSRPGAAAFPGRTGDKHPYTRRCAGSAIAIRITARQAHDITAAPAHPEGQNAAAVLADEAHDSNDLRETIAPMEAPAVIPSRRNRQVFIPHNSEPYKHRNRIERCFGYLKHFRRFATRYGRRTAHFAGFVHLAAAMIWLR